MEEKGIITTWNKRAEEVLGHKAADVVGQVWTDLVVDQWREACLEALEKVQVPGEEVVLPMLTADGLHCSVRCVVRAWEGFLRGERHVNHSTSERIIG